MSGPAQPTLAIRPVGGADMPAVCAIYGHHVLTGCGSFE